MKLMPSPIAWSSCSCASASVFCSPQVMVPRQTRETFKSVPGRFLYCMRTPEFRTQVERRCVEANRGKCRIASNATGPSRSPFSFPRRYQSGGAPALRREKRKAKRNSTGPDGHASDCPRFGRPSARRFEREVADAGSVFGFLLQERSEPWSRAEVRHMRSRLQLGLTHVVFPENKAPPVRVPAGGYRRIVQQPPVVGAVQQGIEGQYLALEQCILRRSDPGLCRFAGLVAG